MIRSVESDHQHAAGAGVAASAGHNPAHVLLYEGPELCYLNRATGWDRGCGYAYDESAVDSYPDDYNLPWYAEIQLPPGQHHEDDIRDMISDALRADPPETASGHTVRITEWELISVRAGRAHIQIHDFELDQPLD